MKTRILAGILSAAVLFAACADDAPAEKVKGSYNCKVTVNSHYQKNGEWRDTTYTYGNGSVSIGKIDDNIATVKLTNSRLNIDETYDTVRLTDFNYQVNLSTSKDSIGINGSRYKALFSGTVTADPKTIALSLKVENYPYSSGKYILSFTSN